MINNLFTCTRHHCTLSENICVKRQLDNYFSEVECKNCAQGRQIALKYNVDTAPMTPIILTKHSDYCQFPGCDRREPKYEIIRGLCRRHRKQLLDGKIRIQLPPPIPGGLNPKWKDNPNFYEKSKRFDDHL